MSRSNGTPILMMVALSALSLGGCVRAQEVEAPSWYLVWKNIYVQGPGLGADSLRPGAVTPLWDGRCDPPRELTDLPVEQDRDSRPITPAIRLTDQPQRHEVIQEHVVAFPVGECPSDAPQLIARWDMDWQYDVEEPARRAVLAAVGEVLPGPLEIWTARSWRASQGTRVVWAFVLSRGEEPGAWALAGVEQSGEAYRTLSAQRVEGWAEPGGHRPELVALVDLFGGEEPELVTVEPLASKIGWSQASTARVYGRRSDGEWALLQEIPLMEYIWVD